MKGNNTMKHLEYYRYDITVEAPNHQGIVWVRASDMDSEHVIKHAYIDYPMSYVWFDIKRQIRDSIKER